MLLVASRFMVFCSVVNAQKKQFRQTTLLQQKTELKQIAFRDNELYNDVKGVEWKENNKEIVLNGKYYEVVSIEKKVGIYVVNIIEDTKENELFEFFFKNTERKGELTDYLTLVLGMNFITSEAIKFKNTQAGLANHQTPFTLKSGIELSNRTEKPPRVKISYQESSLS
ncbi:MAG: hypothetical protein ACK504_09230 [Bacteroidota bacterium]|jgi:hypothetical protein